MRHFFLITFSMTKINLDSVKYSFLNSDGAFINPWTNKGVIKIKIGEEFLLPFYAIEEEIPENARFLAFRSGDENEEFKLLPLRNDCYVFDFGSEYSGLIPQGLFVNTKELILALSLQLLEFQETGIYFINSKIVSGARSLVVYCQGLPFPSVINLSPFYSPQYLTDYSDNLDYNIKYSLLNYLINQTNGTFTYELEDLTIELLERDKSIYLKKPNLLIHKPNRRPKPWSIGVCEIEEEFDDVNSTVKIIALEQWQVEVQLDLGCQTDDEREKWQRKLDRVFRIAEELGGIPVLNYADEGASPTTQVGNIMCRFLMGGIEHHDIDYAPAGRIYQDAITMLFNYEHKYLKVEDDQLLSVEVKTTTA